MESRHGENLVVFNYLFGLFHSSYLESPEAQKGSNYPHERRLGERGLDLQKQT
jgi:hypothetical protein